MSGAKIRLSQKEMELVINAEVILTKNAIIDKVKTLLAELQPAQEEIISQHAGFFPVEVLLPRPKISRGENYKGLPYLILDYPRCFEKENILAIRTMFWWGNFFSITLHLSGIYKNLYEQKIVSAFDSLTGEELYITNHNNQWEHHFERDNYVPVKDLTATEWKDVVMQQEFLKIAQKIPLAQWDDAKNILLVAFKNLICLLKD